MTIDLSTLLKIIIAFGILNVWLIRFKRASIWRGGDSKNMLEEFDLYGLPSWSVGIIGFLKVSLAILLFVSIWYPRLETLPVLGIAILMFGAIGMHIKIGDSYSKSVPAALLFILSLVVYLL